MFKSHPTIFLILIIGSTSGFNLRLHNKEHGRNQRSVPEISQSNYDIFLRDKVVRSLCKSLLDVMEGGEVPVAIKEENVPKPKGLESGWWQMIKCTTPTPGGCGFKWVSCKNVHPGPDTNSLQTEQPNVPDIPGGEGSMPMTQELVQDEPQTPPVYELNDQAKSNGEIEPIIGNDVESDPDSNSRSKASDSTNMDESMANPLTNDESNAPALVATGEENELNLKLDNFSKVEGETPAPTA